MSNNPCVQCIYRRDGAPPDPLMGVRLVSKKVFELRAKWQQELETRATFEQERLLSGEPFDFEPWSFPYCAYFSSEEIVDPVSGEAHSLFTLCAVANPHGDCAEFIAR